MKSGDAPQDGEPLAYDELFSALRYYAGMNKQEILTSSRAYLMSLYSRYVKRACENLGVPSDNEQDQQNQKQNGKSMLKSNAYPRDLKKEYELAKAAAEAPVVPLDTDFLSTFQNFNPNRYDIPTDE